MDLRLRQATHSNLNRCITMLAQRRWADPTDSRRRVTTRDTIRTTIKATRLREGCSINKGRRRWDINNTHPDSIRPVAITKSAVAAKEEESAQVF
ncbi:hypothetical protein CB0940_10590 [Cercospora beticola]|uniref:Uncharacterized protein n=1 Tax=Cercospora beticola TaxID=122368 RepID=A0A2G5HTQ2_CERBT|nr:hypothetical protein CB0940_10590 [Cercospora beticola]PIA95909.1 hypothetical protein CB0940_10590 [Cercospora beticola]